MSDLEQIVKRCQKGEEDAFSKLFDSIAVDVRRILIGTIGPDDEIEDLTQTAFLEIFRSLHRFEGRSRFTTWMYRLTVNVALQHLRNRKKRHYPVDPTDLQHASLTETNTPEDSASAKEHLNLVRSVLDSMAPKKRIVFMLHDIEGYSLDEIVGMVSKSKLTVKSRLFYARKDFNKKLRQKTLLLASNERSKDNE